MTDVYCRFCGDYVLRYLKPLSNLTEYRGSLEMKGPHGGFFSQKQFEKLLNTSRLTYDETINRSFGYNGGNDG